MANLISTDYTKLAELATKKPGRIVGNNTRIRMDGETVVVTLHKSDIVRLQPDGVVHFTFANYPTVTTAERINQFLPRPSLSVSARIRRRGKPDEAKWAEAYDDNGKTNLKKAAWYSTEDFVR